jgi:hypothetical protein
VGAHDRRKPCPFFCALRETDPSGFNKSVIRREERATR